MSALACALAALCAPQDASLARELYRAQLAAAESAIRLDEHAVAREWLDAVDPASRGFEWRVHSAALDASLATWKLDGAHVTALAVSPDGTRAACGTDRGTLELRALPGGALEKTIAAHAEALTDVHFDPAGERVVTTSYDRKVKVFDVGTGALQVEFTQHGYPVGGAVFSPDGESIASCAYERPPGSVVGTVHLWNAADGSVLRTLQGGRKPLVAIEFSPDGRKLAAASWDFCLFVWEVDGGEPVELAVPDEGIYNAVDGVAWSPDGARIAAASKDKTARVWNLASGALESTLRGHTDYVSKLAFSPDGATLATASADGTLRLWNAADGSERAVLCGHADDVLELAYCGGGAQLLSGAADGTLRLWDARSDWYGGARFTTSGAPYVACFDPRDALIATASFDGRIALWSAATLEPLASWQAHPAGKSCHALAWTSDGRRLVSGSWEPVVRVWDAWMQRELAAFEQPEGTQHLAVAPVGERAATCAGKRVHLWDLARLEGTGVFEGHSSTVLAVHFSDDGRRCVSTGRDGKAIVWDAATRAVRCEVARPGRDVAEARFTTDGGELIVALRDGEILACDAVSGAELRVLARHRHGVDHIDLAPDGKRVALASDVVVLVDLAQGGIVGQLRPHREHPYNVDFDSTGERLVSCSTDRTVAVSDVRPLREQLARREQSLAQRTSVETRLAARLAAGETLAAICDALAKDSALPPLERAAWIELLVVRCSAANE